MTYRVMIASHSQPGKMIPIGREYVRRSAAFTKAERIANFNSRKKVTVWEYTGPGESTIHIVHDPAGI